MIITTQPQQPPVTMWKKPHVAEIIATALHEEYRVKMFRNHYRLPFDCGYVLWWDNLPQTLRSTFCSQLVAKFASKMRYWICSHCLRYHPQHVRKMTPKHKVRNVIGRVRSQFDDQRLESIGFSLPFPPELTSKISRISWNMKSWRCNASLTTGVQSYWI